MSKYFIKAELQHMAKEDILSMVSPDTLARIKANDPKPLIKAFAVGHEGEATANIPGMGKRILRYLKDAIYQIGTRLKIGVPVFSGHASTNDHAGREPVGEVVGTTVKRIGQKLHAIAAIYIKNEPKDQPFDVASIEANFEGEEDADGISVIDIDEVTGVALGNSRFERPGFSGATLLGAVQHFTKQGEVQHMTPDEIKKLIVEKGYKPEDLFTSEQIISSDSAKKAKQEEYEHSKRVEESLGKEREARVKAENENVQLKEQMKEKDIQLNKTTTKELLVSVSTERKLDDKFVTFLNRNMEKFKSDKNGDELKNDLNRFIDDQGKEYQSHGKEFGFEAKITKEDGDKSGGTGGAPSGGTGGAPSGGTGGAPSGGTGGAPSGDGANASSDGDQYTDPKKNDFIPS